MLINEYPILAERTTLGIGGKAKKEYVLETVADVEALPLLLAQDKLPCHILGGGSNILAQDGDLNSVLIKDMIGSNIQPQIMQEGKNYVFLTVPSGLRLPVFLGYCGRYGFSGLEGLAGIPGRMGGALAMNAGAFGCDMNNVLVSADIFTPEYGLQKYTKEELNIAYRSFKLQEEVSWFIITSMTLCMEKQIQDNVKNNISLNMAKKKASQPLKYKTAGCVFKNPENDAAGRLIEAVGLRGFRTEHLGFSIEHANFLVNYGEGTFCEAKELIALAQNKVFQTFGVELHTEIKVYHDN